MTKRVPLAGKWKSREDKTKRPELPDWLDPERDMSEATYAQKVSYAYWTKIYWVTPPWLSDEHIDAMQAIYDKATVKDHVDHIVPLKGTLVCGLHVPWNLEVVREKENLQKSNHWWPDHPFEINDLFEGHNMHQMEIPL